MLYKRTEEGADKVIIQGIIDLLIVEPDGATVVDFKTSSASDAYVSRRYARQLELYAEAVTLALKIPVKRKIIYSVFGRREITPG
jgi:ATP-dependent helicase/nuclease subunit A